MNKTNPIVKSSLRWLAWLCATPGLIILYLWLIRPFLLLVTEQAGPFVVTFSTTDLDLDGDTDPDAILVGKRRETLWWNNDQAVCQRAAQSIPCSENQDLTVGDFNGDGKEDIFVAEYDKASQVWFNVESGGFATFSP